MKNYLRFIALILALSIITALFASCSTKPAETEAKDSGVTTEAPGNVTDEEIGEVVETESEYKPAIAQKDYGSEFYLSIMPDVNPVDYYWVKEASNNTLSDAIYARQESVRSYLGVEVIGTPTGNTNTYIEPFKTAVKNKDDSVHFMVSHVFFGIDGFITENYLTDFNDISEIDTYAPYWKAEFMEDLSVNGHEYLGFNNFNILYTNVVSFNKEMLDLYKDYIDTSFYDMVTSYTWTLDKMISIAGLVYTDTNADGKTPDDTFGLTAFNNVPIAPIIQSSGMSLVEMDDAGLYKIAVYNDKNKQRMSDLVDKLDSFARSDCAFIRKDSSTATKIFTEKRALMYLCSTYSLISLLNHDLDFGVLPYPMYDEEQKDVGYRSLNWGGYLCVPSYLKNPTMVYETIDILAYFSEDVNVAFYEKLLGKKVAESPQDRDMLNIVWNSICSDFGQTYGSVFNTNTDFLFMLCNLIGEESNKSLASYVAGGESAANKGLKKFIGQVK